MIRFDTQVPHYRPEGVKRRLHQVVIALYASAIVGCVAMVGGPYLNDRAIAQDSGRALARVMDTSSQRTIVEFRDEEGIYRQPATGVLYPVGLAEGQRVWVSYSKEDPALVKVAGREWTLSVIPALSVLGVSTLIGIFLWWLISVLTEQYIKRSARRAKSSGTIANQ